MNLLRSRALRIAAFGLALVACNSDRVLAPGTLLTPGSTQRLGGASLPTVRIAEFHYDNPGTDANEKIEISGPAGTDLAGWTIVRYNGANAAAGVTYASPAGPTITGIIPASCNGRGVLVFSYPQDGLQNGGNDGFALVDNNGVLVEFLSYEGVMTASNGIAAGRVSTDVGVSETGTASAPPVSSIQRQPDGTWILATAGAVNFGVCNDDNGSVVTPVAASVTVTPATATINQGTTQQYTATAYDASNNPIPGAPITWAATPASIATISASGLATGVGAGDASITATSGSATSTPVTLTVNAAAPYTPPDIRFSELHYDNGGNDVGEAIEIEGPINTNLAGWSIVLYDGNGGGTYGSVVPVNGTLTGTCNLRGVISISFPVNGLQNGSPDGFALVDNNGVLVEFLSYEGTMTGTAGIATGITSRDIGVAEVGNENAGLSLHRSADGQTWSGPTSADFGFVNACGGPPPSSITFSGRSPTSDPALPIGFEGQIFASEKIGGVTQTTTITWSSDTPAIASIDQNGVFRSLSAGSAILRATATDGATATIAMPTSVGTQSSVNYQGNTEFGIPTDADNSDDFIVTHAEFTSSYNKNLGHPNWVSERLDANNYGIQDRCNCFTFDPELDAAGFLHLTTNDYTGSGGAAGFGIDRGHMTRSADRTASDLDNAHTYWFSNVIPQAAAVNQGPWADEEVVLGNFAKAGKEVYVISGGAGSQFSLKGEGKIYMPASVWKVAVIMDGGKGLSDVHSPSDVQVIAVIMPNVSTIGSDWTAYKTTVDAVEALSGYDLLSLLPDNLENAIEANDQIPTARVTGPSTGNEGSALSFDANTSTDPDAGDVLTYSWTFGDGTTGTGVNPSHTFADNGTYTVTVKATDSHNVYSTATLTVTINNVAPTGTLNPGSTNEGSPYTLALSNVTDPSTVDAASLTYQFDCGDGAGFNAVSSSNSRSCASVADDAVRTVQARVIDKDGGSNTYSSTVTVLNVAPTITNIAAPAAPAKNGTIVSITTDFADVGVNDTHAVKVQWGDGGISNENVGSALTKVSKHIYAKAGIYTVTVTVTDDDGGAVSQTTSIIVYDVYAGFVTADSYIGGTTARLLGNVQYNTAGVLSGYMTLVGSPILPVTIKTFDYLVVTGADTATFQGTGVLSDKTPVGVYVRSIDGNRSTPASSDKIRIRVWTLNTGVVLYDSAPGADDLSTPTTTMTGNFAIHS